MKTIKWGDLDHKIPPQEMARIRSEALADYERLGFAALRKARAQTQVDVARKLGIQQAGVSVIENQTDLLLSTLAKYVRALGGEVEIRAVFPGATFNLEPPIASQLTKRNAKRGAASRKAPTARRLKPTAVRA